MIEKDLIIVGGGPAGLTAGMYAARSRLDCLLIEKGRTGGQINITDWIENYPGFPEGISGPELGQKLRDQATKFGLEILTRDIKDLVLSPDAKTVVTEQETYCAKALILACGASPRRLGVEGEGKFTGCGVSYCATCDGAFFEDQEIAVIGGGDTAVEEAIYLTRFASHVYLIHRRDELRATRILQERAFQNDKISVIWETVVERIHGDQLVEGLKLVNVKSGTKSDLPVAGVFVFTGYQPNNSLVRDSLNLDGQGFVVTDEQTQASAPGVFVVGDLRSKVLRQVSTAVGEGAIGAFCAEKYLNDHSVQGAVPSRDVFEIQPKPELTASCNRQNV